MLIVQDQIGIEVQVNGKSLPIGPGTFDHICIFQNMQNLVGTAELHVTDTTGLFQAGAFTDQAPIAIAIGPAVKGNSPATNNFRLFNIADAHPTTAGYAIKFSAIFDSPGLFRKTMTKAYEGTSSSALKKMAGEVGVNFESSGTSDSMTWLPDNRPFGQAMRKIADHGYASANSGMHLTMGTTGSGDWKLMYKDVIGQLQSGSKQFISLNMFRGQGFPVLGVRYRSHAGTLNNAVAYGGSIMQRKLDGKTVIDKAVEAIQSSASLNINSAIKGIVGELSKMIMPNDVGNCQSGDTLIPTEIGLVRMDSLLPSVRNAAELNDLIIASRYSPRAAAAALYAGKQMTYILLTEDGYRLICTKEHPNLVYDPTVGATVWKKTADCSLGDLLVFNPCQITRKTPLNLNLIGPSDVSEMKDFGYGSKALYYPKPRFMTPDLAKVIGYIVSEGHFDGKYIVLSNTNKTLLEDFQYSFEKAFGIKSYLKPALRKENHLILGVEVKSSKEIWKLSIGSVLVCDYLAQMGLHTQKGLQNGKTASYFKDVPWSILEADDQSQMAFMAAYLEADGTIDNKTGRINYYSSSNKLLRKMQILLASHGVACKRTFEEKKGRNRVQRLALTAGQSATLWTKISKYMHTKNLELKHTKYSLNGVPAAYWSNLLQNRLLEKNYHSGNIYINDEGKKVRVTWRENGKSLQNKAQKAKIYQYDKYKAGEYDKVLENIKIISLSAWKKLMTLLENEYYFQPLVDLKKHKKIDVYDIAMSEGEPAFVANGLVVHNTHKDYAKSQMQNEKLKATLSSFVEITTHYYTDVKVMDGVDLIIGSPDAIDPHMSGRYIVHSRTQYVSDRIYREKLVLASQGYNS